MKIRNITILMAVLLLADQLLKIWVKTNMSIGEAFIIFPDWFQIRFVENNGAAFGMSISSSGAFDWGKLLLSSVRIVLIGWLCVMLYRMAKAKTKAIIMVPLALVTAGAIGNLIDSAFYGMIFSASTPSTVAHVGDGYAGFLMGKVVDMFYFPLFQWNNVPSFLSFLVDGNNYFFGAIFNLADAYISVAVIIAIIFNKQIFTE